MELHAYLNEDDPRLTSFLDSFNAIAFREVFKKSDERSLPDALTSQLKMLMEEKGLIVAKKSKNRLMDNEWNLTDLENSPKLEGLALFEFDHSMQENNNFVNTNMNQIVPNFRLDDHQKMIHSRGQYVNMIRKDQMSTLCTRIFGCSNPNCHKVHINQDMVCESFFRNKTCTLPKPDCSKIHLKRCSFGANCSRKNCDFLHEWNYK